MYTIEECEQIAEKASLRYVKDTSPGICRRKFGRGFVYYWMNGEKVTEARILERINSLAIPPAYKNVWICRYANGHIQATGRDERGRKQYIYHPLWRQLREQQKFTSMVQFGHSLSRIRRKIRYELNKPLSLSKSQIICAIIYLLDHACIRIGTPVYAKQNNSYGITTLRKKHVSIHKNKVILDFVGKNGKFWHIILTDKKIINLIKKCEEIPGYEIFKYLDAQNQINVITSQDVNGYLQEITQQPFTAKDFRTWTACRETLYGLICAHKLQLPTEKGKLKAVIKQVAQLLGHTVAVCQKSYIEPDIIAWWQDKRLEKWIEENHVLIRSRNKDKILLKWLSDKLPCIP
ncbi:MULTISPECIES: DNA topoisomerase IB [Legionella]|uniref:DNA topoisomerase n=1 Tax=Legionella septentrionalis TaxID=2498109 RepID=A0A3S0V4Y6_9GAMM|nr:MULTISPECIES: DNA topoisomerase IB [Legionella]MCP0914545.1 DNA topoisomerase IB [Legionella sp. 27cVA30]RUQ84982.1 DNA topoisomerase IB [Legionella septentrionalis]RUR02383.1 DNA topoisomerase IB [Legionella septentrionalis]RUR17040.1 DNA topoisomerase IB [Legionella septentrionalis]